MSVMDYSPGPNDYKIWLVINPAKWLVPIWITVLATAIIVHAFVISSPKYNFLAPAKTAVTQVK